VEILLASFLNLMNGDWLRRPAWWLEALTLVVSGLLLGGGLCRVRLPIACAIARGLPWWWHAGQFPGVILPTIGFPGW